MAGLSLNLGSVFVGIRPSRAGRVGPKSSRGSRGSGVSASDFRSSRGGGGRRVSHAAIRTVLASVTALLRGISGV